MTRSIPNGRLTCRVRDRAPARSALPSVLGWCLLACASLPGQSAAAQKPSPGCVTVQARTFARSLTAYGQVAPVALTPVAAAESGVIAGLRARPGTRVRAGEELAHLSGPALSSLLLQSEAGLRSAKAQWDAAQKSLQIQREQLPSHLTTRQAVQQAESAAAQAHTALENAQSKLKSTRLMMAVRAPADGLVLTLSSANGALVGPGQTILTLQPAGGLWLQATYYGADLADIRVGMSGSFAPADGSRPIPVRVVSLAGTLAPGGGESIALEPAQARSFTLSGEAGTVTLQLPAKNLVEVPTRALIVNQGRWWVLVHTAQGDHAQQVVPGPADGWNTVIESGLNAGTQIVVNNAYLLFHSGIAEQFQIPD